MDWQTALRQQSMTMYQLSRKSGVPKTTVIDICSGRSDIEKCSGKTIRQLASALSCSMEDVMKLRPSRYDKQTVLPKDKDYLECGLPAYLQKSIDDMKASWALETFLPK